MTQTEMQSYSQYGEDRAIVELFGDHVGRFLDIGAWHPTVFSNTRALFERGWSGVMVEPSPCPFLKPEIHEAMRVASVSAGCLMWIFSPHPKDLFHLRQS